MNNREEWVKFCSRFREVASSGIVPYGENTLKRINHLEEELKSYEFKVYLVGPFSCGKSTLLNNWLGASLLPKGIRPETAVATELHYAEDEKTVLCEFGQGESLGKEVMLDGVGLDQLKKATEIANQGKLARVRLYINNTKLQQYSDVCLVDLPGLSSTCRAHELAINQFLMEKSVGVFCVPMPAGTIQQDALEFLQEMERYRASFNLLLTKADECRESDHDSIKKHVSTTIQNRLGIPESEFHVGIVSKDDVSAFTEQLDFLSEQREHIFTARFAPEIRSLCVELLTPLQFALSKDFSDEKIESALSNLQEAEAKLNSIFVEVSTGIADAVPGAVDRVVENVKDTLREKANGWIAKMKNGQEVSEDIASTLKRTVMYHAGNEAHEICDNASRKASHEFGKCLSFSLGDIGAVSVEGVGGKMHTSGEIFTSSVKGFAVGAAGYAMAIGTVGAAIGSVVPVIGTGIGFVVGTVIGGIVGAFSSGGSKVSENSRIQAELLEQLEMEGEKTRAPVTQLLNDVIEDFNSKMKTSMEEKLFTIRGQIDGLRSESERNHEEFISKKSQWESAVAEIEAIANTVE